VSIQHFQNVVGVPTVDVVSLLGNSVLSFTLTPVAATAELFWNSDGTIDGRQNSGPLIQLHPSTDWIIPNGAAPDDYEFRYTAFGGSPLDFASAAEDVWRALSLGNFTMRLGPTVGVEFLSCGFTGEIRKGSSGGAIASASYILAASEDI